MAADNLIPVVATTGSSLRTLADGSGVEWAAGVTCFAITVSAGANVLSVVTPTNGMPSNIVQVGGSALALGQTTLANSIPVAIASNQTALNVSQSGGWTTTVVGTAQVQGNVASGSTDSGNPVKVGGVFNSAAPALTTGQRGDMQLDSSANLKVNVAAGSVSVSNFPATQPVSGTVTANQGGAPWSENITQIGGSALALGSHTSAASVPVVIASDQGAVSVAQSGTWNITVNTALPAGGNQIGHVVVDGLPSIPAGSATIGNVGIVAGSALIGEVAAGPQIASCYNGATAVAPQYAVINASSSGSNTLITGTAGKKIYVLRFRLNASGAVNAKFQTSSGPADISGLLYFAANGAGQGGAFCPAGLFATGTGDNLILNLSAAVAVSGELTYVVF